MMVTMQTDKKTPFCGSSGGEVDCGDGIDNDGDGAIETEDPNCGR